MDKYVKKMQELDENAHGKTPYHLFRESQKAGSAAIVRELAKRGFSRNEIRLARRFSEAMPYNETGLTSEHHLSRVYSLALEMKQIGRETLLDEIHGIAMELISRTRHLRTTVARNPLVDLTSKVSISKTFLTKPDPVFFERDIVEGDLPQDKRSALLKYLGIA